MRFEVEVVTPLFLGGAEVRGAPELRAASIRGALRFWLRALLGGVIGDKDIKALHQAESAVFGSTDTGASPVVVRVLNSPKYDTVSFSELVKGNPSSQSYQYPGLAYLFFSARGRDFERAAIAARSRFEVGLSLRAGVLDPKAAHKALSQAYAALWALTHLGGLGARSRRGAGSIQVTEVQENPLTDALPSLEIRASTPELLKTELQEGLSTLRKSIGEGASVDSPSSFDVLHPKVCKICVLNKEYSTWEEALDEIGRRMQQFRIRRDPDYRTVKEFLRLGKSLTEPLPRPIERAAFGLPIVFYFSSLGGARGTLEGEFHTRRASPLWIRLTRLANGKYTLVLTCFQAQLLEGGEFLKLRPRKGSPVRVKAPDLSLIDKFIAEVQKHICPCLQVTGW